MKTSGIRETPWTAVPVIMAGLFMVAASQGLMAQEADWVPREKARIGVLLEESCTGWSTVDAVCDTPPTVTSVVVGGPADEAGIQANDTLLSVDGLDVTREEGRALLLGLEAGVPVDIEIGRKSGRTQLRVTPEMRATEPYVDVRTVFVGPGGEPAEGSSEHVRVMRIPSVQSRLSDVEIRLDSLRVHGNDFVFFSDDADGTFKVEVGDPETAHLMLERIREHEGEAARTESGTSSDVRRYVWENEELARRLMRVRDSSFRSARVQLDSLVRLRQQVQVLAGDSLGGRLAVTSRVSPDGAWAYFVTPRPIPGPLRMLLASDLRVAGAEFRELTGDLAEYFDGADQGLLVLRVIRDTPAARLGLRGGDVLVEVEGRICNQIGVLRDAVSRAGLDGSVAVKWIRKGTVHTGSLSSL